MPANSTEFGIIAKSLEDVTRRLDAAPQTPAIQQLVSRVVAYQREAARWNAFPPSEGERTSLMQRVLTIHIELMKGGFASSDEQE